MPLDMTNLQPPPTTAQLTAKEQLELFVATAQFRLSMVSIGVYFVILAIFLSVLKWIAKDNQLTLAVLLLQPLTLLVGNLASFWLQRQRPAQGDSQLMPTVTSTAGPGGTATQVSAAAPALPPTPPAAPESAR